MCIRDSISTELKVSRRDYASRPIPFTGDALPQVGLRFSGALPAGTPAGVSTNNRFLNLGTERSRHFNILETQTDDIYAGATWNLGAHELKFGLDYSKNEMCIRDSSATMCRSWCASRTASCSPQNWRPGWLSKACHRAA